GPGNVEPVVVGEVPRRGHAHRTGGEDEQLLGVVRLGRRGRGEGSGREETFWHVVPPLEGRPPPGADLPGPEEVLQCRLARAATPHARRAHTEIGAHLRRERYG